MPEPLFQFRIISGFGNIAIIKVIVPGEDLASGRIFIRLPLSRSTGAGQSSDKTGGGPFRNTGDVCLAFSDVPMSIYVTALFGAFHVEYVHLRRRRLQTMKRCLFLTRWVMLLALSGRANCSKPYYCDGIVVVSHTMRIFFCQFILIRS